MNQNPTEHSTLTARERRRRSVNAARRKYWRRQADGFLALGLTTRGTVRKYRQHELPYMLGERVKRRLRQRALRRELMVNGFSVRGRDRWTAQERNWRNFRARIQLPDLEIPLANRKRFEP